jgi:hypothetical protein
MPPIIAAVRNAASGRGSQPGARPARGRRRYGQHVPGLTVDGKELQAGVFDDNEVRAASGLALVVGVVAFCYAAFKGNYIPLQAVASLLVVDFLIRVTAGLRYSPAGITAHAITRNPPQWVSARPKRFAWTLGLVVALAMAVITSVGIRGYLPETIGVILLLPMWAEAALGLCLGCEMHGRLVRRGWLSADPGFEVCANGACDVPQPASQARNPPPPPAC